MKFIKMDFAYILKGTDIKPCLDKSWENGKKEKTMASYF